MSGEDERDAPDRREPDQKALRELHLAEFSALRAEIGARSGVQHQLMALNITALAAIGGFVISDKADPLLLLMLPLVSCALGVIWHDHARNIENIGSYIKDELGPALLDTVPRDPDGAQAGGDGLRYEERIDEDELRVSSRVLPLAVPLLILFGAFPATAAVFALLEMLRRNVSTGIWVVWAAGVGMIALYLWAWLVFVGAPYQRRRAAAPGPSGLSG
jgi:hypothetical protein